VVAGERSEERDVVFRADFLGETERLSRKSLEGRGASGIYRKSDCIVMITAHGDCRDSFHPLDDLMRSWPIVHQIADTPELVKFPLWQGLQRGQICVNVGNDDKFHKSSASGAQALMNLAPMNSNSDEDFMGAKTPRRDLVRSHHPTFLGPGRAAVPANPFALCRWCNRCTQKVYQLLK